MQHWFQSEKYPHVDPIPKEFLAYAGPHGIATVRAFEDGRTSKGWGTAEFMDNYRNGKFNDQIAKVGWVSGRWNFAFVMRSLRLICIDIDGKNGGLSHVGKLGQLPRTLAETSRSGDGYHLFYFTDETWDEDAGFAKFRDRIGVLSGVDVRSTGCVYHWPGQQWNGHPIQPLPKFLDTVWTADEAAGTRQTAQIEQVLLEGDEDEIMLMRHDLSESLKKPIPVGRRNSTLFAIGAKMLLAGTQGWEQLIYQRAIALGLSVQETNKIIANIGTYR